MIPLSVPNLKGNELKYVTEAVEDEWVSTGGGFINQFELNMADYLKVGQAIACQSGTAGLHLALQLAGVSKDEEVIVPTLTFIAAVNPIKYLGADPIFMDCDDTLNMDMDKLDEFCKHQCHLTNDGLVNKNSGKRIKALIVVHVFGNIADMDRLMQIAEAYNLKVIEDSTEALGSYYTSGNFKNKFAGTIGDFGVYSFNGNKIITTGGGGMLVAKDSKKAEEARYLSTQAKDDTLYYRHDNIGYNYRMTNLQAALGVAQLEQLEKFITIKKTNYDLYKTHIENIDGLGLLTFDPHTRPNYWFYSLVIDVNDYGLDRDTLLKRLNEEGIQTRPIWGLIHEQRPYETCQAYRVEKAKRFVDTILNLPCSTNLNQEDVLRVINTLNHLKNS